MMAWADPDFNVKEATCGSSRDPLHPSLTGVLTKLDIMDRGTSAAHILRNAHIPLRLGYVGVVLRCQEDINNKAPMADARK
jgi:dynamin 1-like protein